MRSGAGGKREIMKIHVKPKLTRAGKRLAAMIEEEGRPVLTRRDLFSLVQKMYREMPEGLRLRREMPEIDDYRRLCSQLKAALVLAADGDYGSRVWRVASVHDLPSDEIVCIVDPFCHISHLSAMQRWSPTDRVPRALMITRPERRTVRSRLKALEKSEHPMPFPAESVRHPERVRRRPVLLRETRHAGASIRNPAGFDRVATYGQTFLDMVSEPELCGGMAHVIEVWREHASERREEIIEAVDGSAISIAKCRAGHILEERVGIEDARIERWRVAARRGGSRRLDPARPFSSNYSGTWMISLNV